jgi:hypothetical protein
MNEELELPLRYEKLLCVKCGERPVYLPSATQNWCEQCLWELVINQPPEDPPS